MLKRLTVIGSLVIIFSVMLSVIFLPGFASWDSKPLADYYLRESFAETKSPNVVGSVVWDFRSFDTMGEETVLFTAAIGVFSLMMFNLKKERGDSNGHNS